MCIKAIKEERHSVASIPLVDLGYLIRMADAQKEGLQPKILRKHSGDAPIALPQKANSVAVQHPTAASVTAEPVAPSLTLPRRPKDDIVEPVAGAERRVVDPEMSPVTQEGTIKKKPRKKRLPKVIVLEDIPIN